MKIERINVAELSLDPSNVRKHDRKNLDAIKASLRKFGQQKPIVVDAKGIVLAGNGTLTAAKELGWTEIEITRTTLQGVEATAFAIADNRSAELAEWEDSLADVLKSLANADIDLAELGFDQNALEKISSDLVGDLEVDAEPQLDKTEELRAKWGVELGQVWQLGDHRLACGNSTDSEIQKILCNGESIDAVVSDPPYGMNYLGTAGTAQQGMDNVQRRKVQPVIGDDKKFDPTWMLELCPSGDVMLWGADWFYGSLPEGGSWIVWDKRASKEADETPGAPFEICWSRRRQERRFIRFPWGGWINKERGEKNRWHPTQKPVQVMIEVLASTKGNTILEPYCGSGTTIIACEQLGRKCRAIELNPAYVAVAIQRWADATGKTPIKL
jgi:16S rRNA G966 N2-methylase RsmD